MSDMLSMFTMNGPDGVSAAADGPAPYSGASSGVAHINASPSVNPTRSPAAPLPPVVMPATAAAAPAQATAAPTPAMKEDMVKQVEELQAKIAEEKLKKKKKEEDEKAKAKAEKEAAAEQKKKAQKKEKKDKEDEKKKEAEKAKKAATASPAKKKKEKEEDGGDDDATDDDTSAAAKEDEAAADDDAEASVSKKQKLANGTPKPKSRGKGKGKGKKSTASEEHAPTPTPTVGAKRAATGEPLLRVHEQAAAVAASTAASGGGGGGGGVTQDQISKLRAKCRWFSSGFKMAQCLAPAAMAEIVATEPKGAMRAMTTVFDDLTDPKNRAVIHAMAAVVGVISPGIIDAAAGEARPSVSDLLECAMAVVSASNTP